LLRSWLGPGAALVFLADEVGLAWATGVRAVWAALGVAWLIWLPLFTWISNWPLGTSVWFVFWGYPLALSPLGAFVVGGVAVNAVCLGTYLFTGREYRPGSARDEAKGWLALALVAVSLSAWWPAHQAFRVSRGLGSAGVLGGGLLLAAQMTYCW